MPENVSQSSKRSTKKKGALGMIVALSFVIGGVAGGASGALFGGFGDELFSSISSETQEADPADVKGSATTVLEISSAADVVERVNPAVVSIISTKEFQYYRDDPLFGPFSRRVPDGDPERLQVGGGSGFIIADDGMILTNKHVVADATVDYTVLLSDGTEYDAKVVATDPFNDLAFMDIDARGLPVMELGDSDQLRVGQEVLAFGNPLGDYSNSVTGGIVSGLDRKITAGGGSGSTTLDQVIQTDAAINPGNSGGPLVNLAGQVVGVNTAIDAEGQSIGFAIPINEAAPIIESVQQYGRIIRPVLGVRYTEITPSLAETEDLPVSQGAWVTSGVSVDTPAVIPDSAAANAGLKDGDIIVQVDDVKVDSKNTLAMLIKNRSVGDALEITFLRDGDKQTVTAVLKEYGIESL